MAFIFKYVRPYQSQLSQKPLDSFALSILTTKDVTPIFPRKIILILLLSGLFIFSVYLTQATAATSYAAEDGSTVYVVVITDKKLKGVTEVNPATIRIKTGDSIEWENEDGRIHFINSRKKKAGKGGLRFKAAMVRKGGKWINKFTKPGTYNYYCSLHSKELSGMIIVGVDPSEEVKIAEAEIKVEILAPPKEDLIEERSYKAEDGSTVHVVIITDKSLKGRSKFVPATSHVKTGDYIEWINEDARVHFLNTKLKFTGFKKKGKKGDVWFSSKYVKKGAKYKVRFTKPGFTKYFCFTHPLELFGDIRVEGEPIIETVKIVEEESVKKAEILAPGEVMIIEEDTDSLIRGEGETHIVNIPEKSKVFIPAVLTIGAGDTIRWTNNDHSIEAHKIASVPGTEPENREIKITIIKPDTYYEHTFNREGEYLYFCFVHQGMVGTITVKAADKDAQ